MRIKNKSFKIKKGIEAVLEVSILIISIFAMGYLLGDEFRLVSASGDDICSEAGAVSMAKKVCIGKTFDYTYTVYIGTSKKPETKTTKCPGKQNCEGVSTKTSAKCKQLGGECLDFATCQGSEYSVLDTSTTTCGNGKYCCTNIGTRSGTECTKDSQCTAGKVCLDGHCVGLDANAVVSSATLLTDKTKKGGTVTTSTVGPDGTTTTTQVDFGKTISANWQNMIINGGIAIGLFAGGKWVGGNVLGVSNRSSEGLGWALGVGYGAGALAFYIGQASGLKDGLFAADAVIGPIPWIAVIGAVVAAGIWLLTPDYSYDLVSYNCNSWQPVTGGSKCEQCNKGLFPCTKYKCQSLGQSCELVNEGTGNELCVWNNRNDISPPTIRAWNGALSSGYEYIPDDATLAPDTGVIIKNTITADGCAPPYTILKYGVSLDKPGQCKMDVIRKTDYDSMSTALSSGIFKYNHTLISYSGGINKSEEGLSFANGGNYEVYVRCQSKNGYSNVGTFVFKYCISDEPDISAPSIIATDPINGNPVAYGQTDKDVNVYVNKPSECKWSHSDVDFDLMTETMSCSQTQTSYNSNIVFKCSTTLTGLKDGVSNSFYMRCKSYPGEAEENRYKNVESYKYTLVGTRPLVLDWVTPNGTTIKDSTTSVNVTLRSHTSAGYKEGEAQCYYKDSSQTSEDNYVLFFSDASTYNYEHSQELWLEEGSYSYDVKCCDLGGNCEAATTEFDVETDTDSPMVIRIYNDNNKLKIVTDERAECVYSTTDCNYLFADGLKLTTSDYTEHLAEWNTASNLYIKCQDEFGNQPDPNACTITVRPFSEYTTA